jgi:hypothetical protein
MPTSADIEEIATEDAAPTSAPFKISAKPSKDVLSFRVKAAAGALIHAIRVRFKPLNRNSGQLLFSRGMVCGSGDRCGSPTAMSLAAASPLTTGTITVNESQVGSEPDGEYEVRAWAASGEGWSS